LRISLVSRATERSEGDPGPRIITTIESSRHMDRPLSRGRQLREREREREREIERERERER
jgi:hypothetical protein